MFSALVSIVGTTTSVRDCEGSPREKSIRGSGRGVTSNVAIQLTMPSPSWLVASSRSTASVHSRTSEAPSPRAVTVRAAVRVPAIAAIAPRYSSNGTRRATLRRTSAGGGRIVGRLLEP